MYDFVELDGVYYAGSHGLDIAAPVQSMNNGDPKHQTSVVDREVRIALFYYETW